MAVHAGRIVGGLIAVAAVAAVVWMLMPQPVTVETAQVTSGRFVATVDEDGMARVRERYVVAAPLAGRSTRIGLKVGDRVEAGDVIAAILPAPAPLLDPRARREAEERLSSAEAELKRTRTVVERARAETAKAKLDVDRARMLVQRGAATAESLERDQLAWQIADRDLRAAEFRNVAAAHEAEQIRALIARYSQADSGQMESWIVTAPVSGVILAVRQESATVVAPGTPLADIGNPHDLEVVVDVLSSDAVEIRPGAEVAIVRWGGPGNLQGRVRRVEPTAFTKLSALGVEEQRVNVLIDIVSPPDIWASLGDGYRAEARITVFSRDDATIVPAGALFRAGEAWRVYVVEGGRAEPRTVTLLLRRAVRTAAIAAGLKPGETVIVYPGDKVAPGVTVAPN
jgi:HlyD family secretion protein